MPIKYIDTDLLKEEKIEQPEKINYENYFTKIGLFKYVDKNVSNVENPHKVDIKYNEKYGYVSYFYMDKDKRIADEEIGFQVTNFIINKQPIDPPIKKMVFT